jgi:hypothetical protein
MPPSGNYLPRIASAVTMVINFGVSSCDTVKTLSKGSIQKARNGPSTQLNEATSCIERSNATMKAVELS